uniref:Uncharacterized protein n=1 Tax=Macrostomum lignano TaxID=282301 RepID=A0A1I8IHH3_9PLAT
MAALDALGKPRYPLGRRHTRNRTSYGSMHHWLHSELSGHNLSGYQDTESHLVAVTTDRQPPGPGAKFLKASQRGCQTVPEEEQLHEAGDGLQRLVSPCAVMPDYPQYRELRQCMTERDRNRHGVNYRAEDLAQPAEQRTAAVPKLPILPSPRPHDQSNTLAHRSERDHRPFHFWPELGKSAAAPAVRPRAHGYDDAHKAYLKQSRPPQTERQQPRLRNGKGGSTWRHLKFAMQPDGQRTQFLDGQVSMADAYRRQLALQPGFLDQHRQQQQRVANAATERIRQQAYVHEV